jgi:hypothetical protein
MRFKQKEGNPELLRGHSKNINFHEAHVYASFKIGHGRQNSGRGILRTDSTIHAALNLLFSVSYGKTTVEPVSHITHSNGWNQDLKLLELYPLNANDIGQGCGLTPDFAPVPVIIVVDDHMLL